MTAIELLENLEREGFEIEARGGEICCRGAAPLSPDLLEKLKKYKPEILEVLTSHDQEFIDQLESAGLIEKWKNYLLERVDILTKDEGYSQAEAKAEVLTIVSHYRKLN